MRSLPVVIILALLAGPAAAASDGVNAVLGDDSFVARYGVRPPAGVDEDLRLRIHLEYVEALLRGADTSSLTPAQRAARARNLDLLHAYHQRGVFPKNHVFAGRRPHFIDEAGRICAVGYLIEQTAGRDVAEAINARHEWAYVTEMRSEPLAAWAASSGLQIRELAMIQPGYPWEPPIQPPQPHPPAPRPIRPPLPEDEGATQLALARAQLDAASMRVRQCVAGLGAPSGVRQIDVAITLKLRAVAIRVERVGGAALRACVERAVASRVGGLFFQRRTRPLAFHHVFPVAGGGRGAPIDRANIAAIIQGALEGDVSCGQSPVRPARIDVTIDPSGRVIAVRLRDAGDRAHANERCLRELLSTAELPPFVGRPTVVEVELDPLEPVDDFAEPPA